MYEQLETPGANDAEESSYSLIISGSASDIESSLPIEEIKITLTATEISEKGKATEIEKTSYTGSDGLFTLKAEGFTNPVSIILTAEDPNGKYDAATHEIPLISWDSSYNMSGNSFYINDCDFHLKRSE